MVLTRKILISIIARIHFKYSFLECYKKLILIFSFKLI